MGEHFAYLAVLALGEAHLDPAIGSSAPFKVGVDRPVVNSLDGAALGEPFQLLLRHMAVGTRPIRPNNSCSRQLQLPLQAAVIGEKKQPLGHEIEPSDGHQPWKAAGKPVVD